MPGLCLTLSCINSCINLSPTNLGILRAETHFRFGCYRTPQHGMAPERDPGGDLRQMEIHRLRVAPGQHQACGLALGWADRTEDVGVWGANERKTYIRDVLPDLPISWVELGCQIWPSEVQRGKAPGLIADADPGRSKQHDLVAKVVADLRCSATNFCNAESA